jgi:metal transporter CNNM
MEALPIFLNYMFNEFVAVVLSVTFVLAFGEVIPQAVCSRHGLSVGASLIWLVKILMLLCWPISYPVGKILDHILGHNDSALFRRAQLKALVSIHGKEAGKGGELTHDETTIIRGALDLTEKTALDSMTPLESTFSLDVHTKLSGEVIDKIVARGHSRIPVYEGDKRNLVGVLLVKSLLTAHVKAETPLTDVRLRKVPRVPSDMPLYDILNEFQKGSSHMAAVTKVKGKKKRSLDEIKAKQRQEADANRDADLEKGISDEVAPEDLVEEDEYDDVEVGQVIGIITLEDVIEELLQEEIVDETDEFVDVANRVKVAAAAAAQMNKGTLFLRAASYKNPQMGMSKQGHNAIKKVRQVEDEAMKQNRLNRLGMSGSNDLTDPLLDRE